MKWYRPPVLRELTMAGTFALDGGSALINQGVHTVDLLLWLLGDVVRVQARTSTQLHKIEAEDTAAAILEFSSGALGLLHATNAAYPGYPRRVEISGTEGTVVLEHDRIIAANLRNSNPPRSNPRPRRKSGFSASVSDFRGHQSSSKIFQTSIKNRAPACGNIEGRRSLALSKPYTAPETLRQDCHRDGHTAQFLPARFIPRCGLVCSEGNASLPWNKIVLGQQLCLGLGFSAGNLNYAIQDFLAHLLDGLLSPNNAARVNVDDVRHLLCEPRIGREFHHRRNGISCRSSQAGRKQNDVCSRTYLSGDTLYVVTRRTLEVKSRLG